MVAPTCGGDPPALEGVGHRWHDLSTGVRAHVAHAGPEDGPAVLLLHGFPQHWYCWRRVIPLLDGSRVLAMDTRGLGWSGPGGDYRKARIAEDAVALLDALGSSAPRSPGTTGAAGSAGTPPCAPRALARLRRLRHPPPVAAAAQHAPRLPGSSISRRSRCPGSAPR